MSEKAPRKTRRTYTSDFKQQIIDLYRNGKRKWDIIRQYDIASSLLDKWIIQAESSGSFSENDNRTPEQEELIRLQKKLKIQSNTTYNYLSSYYIVVVFIVPLQGLYAILLGDTVDWFIFPTTRWFQKGSNHSLFVYLLISQIPHDGLFRTRLQSQGVPVVPNSIKYISKEYCYDIHRN